MNNELSSEDRAKQAAARWRQDMEDFHNELTGNETGRRSRFLGGKSTRAAQIEKERNERRFRDALDLLLQDPEYRALYEELGNKLGRAEVEADAVIADLQARIAELDAQIADMEDRAARGPDGQPVFRTADGRVVDADGNELSPEIVAGIIWPPGSPSAEEYFGARQQREAIADLLAQWLDYRNDTLGGIRDRYDDRDNPIKKDDLPGVIKEIDKHKPPLPEALAVTRTAAPPLAPTKVAIPQFMD